MQSRTRAQNPEGIAGRRANTKAMAELTASRTLVKSSPELWAECSDAASLARHLGAFGEIRITRLESETAVAWEGEDVRGTVTLEPSGWGTRVVLTAETAMPGPAEQPQAEPIAEEPIAADVSEQLAAEPSAEPEAIEPGPAPRRGLFGRLFGFWRRPTPADADLTPSDESDGPDGPLATTEPTPELSARAIKPLPTEKAAPPQTDASPQTSEAAPSAALVGALDSLGQAHRRPFSRG